MPEEVKPKPAPLGEIKIVDMRKSPSLKAERVGKYDVHFTYMIGSEGPFMISVPAEELEGKEFAEQAKIVRKYIEAEQSTRLMWRGATI
ncbi:MAG: hypothetical protein JRD89_10885 [Deltaproteobacteria bacterium]|nr:hypothetical protein [Deltaproteobacteria bacterium]